MLELDRRVFFAVYGGDAPGTAHGAASGLVLAAMIALTVLGSGWSMLGLLPLFAMPRSRRLAGAIFATLASASAIVFLLKHLVARVRPLHALTGVSGLFDAPTDFSFPSGHAAGSFAFAAFVAALLLDGPRRRLGWRAWAASAALFALAAAIAVSRVYLGCHFPADVAAGALVGALVGGAAGRLYARAPAAVPRGRGGPAKCRPSERRRPRYSGSEMRLVSSWGVRLMATACASALAAAYVGCSDLIVPQNGADGGGGGGSDGDVTPTDGDPGADSNTVDGGGDGRPGRLDCAGQDAAFGPPNDLGCTGLYSDFAKRAVSPDAQEFDPGLHLWSDGADKTRWISIPTGQKIDTSDMNEWRFPVGTKLWKEFRIAGRRVETRHFWKRGSNDWVRTTYRWTDDESAAQSLTEGAANVGGTTYGIPTVAQCDTCHSGRIDKVLGFDAVSMSSPQSKFQGQTPAMLAVAPLLTAPPSVALVIPGDALAAPALGWLHANCGAACHNPSPSSFAGVTGLFMRLEVGPTGLGAYEATNTYKTAVCQTSRFQTDPPTTGAWVRIFPGNLGRSLLPFRDGRRNDVNVQMPPLASNIPDLVGTKLVQDWVATGTFPTQTVPCPQP